MTVTSVTADEEGLPAVLRAAAAEVIIEKGLGAFSIREVARRAGVSHAAPGYHFGDLRGLLTSLAIEGLQTLHREMAAAAESKVDAAERLTAIGQAYVRVGTTYPAHCEVIWREDLVDVDDPDYEAAGLGAFGLLEETVRAIADQHNPDLDISGASKLCWSAMQGLVQLRPKLARLDDVQQQEAIEIEELVARFTTILIDGMAGSRPPS